MARTKLLKRSWLFTAEEKLEPEEGRVEGVGMMGDCCGF
jgi:hypothetical protein